MITSFREMEVWQLAHELSVSIFEMSSNLPRSEDYALTSQIRRSSNGVGASIAEGYGRRTKKDKSYFYTIAKASALETQHHLIYGKSIGYFNQDQVSELLDEYDKLIHQLNKIMKSLE